MYAKLVKYLILRASFIGSTARLVLRLPFNVTDTSSETITH